MNTRQRLLLEKVTLETKVKSMETDLLTAVEQRDRLDRVSSTAAPIFDWRLTPCRLTCATNSLFVSVGAGKEESGGAYERSN